MCPFFPTNLWEDLANHFSAWIKKNERNVKKFKSWPQKIKTINYWYQDEKNWKNNKKQSMIVKKINKLQIIHAWTNWIKRGSNSKLNGRLDITVEQHLIHIGKLNILDPQDQLFHNWNLKPLSSFIANVDVFREVSLGGRSRPKVTH